MAAPYAGWANDCRCRKVLGTLEPWKVHLLESPEPSAPVEALAQPASLPVPRLTREAFFALGIEAVIRADVPLVIEMLPPSPAGARIEKVRSLLDDAMVTCVKKAKDPNNTERSETTKIRLGDFFDERVYNAPGAPYVYRVVSNVKNRPDTIEQILGFNALATFNYQSRSNTANIWLNYRETFGRSHFDDYENFNFMLEGRKRFVLLPPGFRNYYIRSMLNGFGHHSKVVNFDKVDLARFPRLREPLKLRREVVLQPGEMLYLPLSWWHHVEPLDHVNLNLNFWLESAKLIKMPYQLVDSIYKRFYRRAKGLYDYQPEKK